MKLLKLFTMVILLTNSCAFFNPRVVEVSINSNPMGAEIDINGMKFGKTPKLLDLEPNRSYEINITKDDHVPSRVKLDWHHSIREGRDGQSTMCLLDTLMVFPIIFRLFDSYSVRCKDFKESQHMVNLTPVQNNSNNQNIRMNRKMTIPDYNQGQVSNIQEEYRGPKFVTAPYGSPPGAPGYKNQKIVLPGERSKEQDAQNNQINQGANNRPPNGYQQYGRQYQQQPNSAQQEYQQQYQQPRQARPETGVGKPDRGPDYYQEYLNRQRGLERDYDQNPYENNQQNFNVPDKNDYNNWQ